MGKAADLLRRGIAATRAGRKREAEQLLRQVIALGPNNEWAWFWLSAVVEGIEAQRECLHRALEINPDNGYARSGLAFLSRLRPGLEWQAEDAPWTDGVDERVMGGGESPRRCPRCGTINPGWAYTCSRCGTVLQTIDLVKVVQQEERIYSRTSAGLSVVEAWASAIVLRGSAAFGPEVELASWGRALSAFMTGGLFFIFLRGVIPGLVWALAMRRAPLLSMLQDLPALLADGGLTVGGIWVGALVLSFLLFPPARLMGGGGGLPGPFPPSLRGCLRLDVHHLPAGLSSLCACAGAPCIGRPRSCPVWPDACGGVSLIELSACAVDAGAGDGPSDRRDPGFVSGDGRAWGACGGRRCPRDPPAGCIPRCVEDGYGGDGAPAHSLGSRGHCPAHKREVVVRATARVPSLEGHFGAQLMEPSDLRANSGSLLVAMLSTGHGPVRREGPSSGRGSKVPPREVRSGGSGAGGPASPIAKPKPTIPP